MKVLVAKIFSSILFVFLLSGCNANTEEVSPTDTVTHTDAFYLDAIDNLITSETEELLFDSICYNITQEEIDGLIHMRIEEKLARDVYTVMDSIWSSQVFLNIKASEQKHMDAVKRMLDKYSIPDPLITDEIGVFPDSTIQDLYVQYIAQGNLSLEEALLAGVAIEELEIADLEYQLANVVANPCILNLYTNLMVAENKHLAAFNKNLGY